MRGGQVNAQQNAFLRLAVPAAQASQRKYDVPASVTIAQAILESSNPAGWGKSHLALEANNYFGIKATHSAAPDTYMEFQTHEYLHNHIETIEAKFAKYANPAASFDAHARLLATAPRYQPAMHVCHDPEAFCIQLQKCGYSTSPSYGVTLAKLINDYDLTQYDVPPEDPAQAAEVAA
jgi:flagellum-specific peptidoglycan hydrolase FlgJ